MTPAEAINDLFKQKVCWLSDSGPEDDIAISSRIRFARNLAGESFPLQSTDDALRGIRDEVFAALRKIGARRHFRMRDPSLSQGDPRNNPESQRGTERQKYVEDVYYSMLECG